MTSNSSPQPSTQTPESDRRRRRRPVLAFGLAILAVGGIGAAATSAAWTDTTFFSASANAASFNLQGSLDGTNWRESNDARSIELVVPAAELANLLPGESRTVSLWVRNEGSVRAALTSEVSFSSSSFADAPAVSVDGLAGVLAPAGTSESSDRFELTITTPADWSAANQGATGTVTVTVAATAVA